MDFLRLGLKVWGTWRCRNVTSFMSAEHIINCLLGKDFRRLQHPQRLEFDPEG